MTESCLGASVFRVSCKIEFSHSSLSQTSLDSQFKMRIGIFFESQSNCNAMVSLIHPIWVFHKPTCATHTDQVYM